MAWEVDQRVQGLKNATINLLNRAISQTQYSQSCVRTIDDRTHVALGDGHAEGDRIIEDIAQSGDCLSKAQACLQTALDEAKRIDTMMWVPDE